MNPGYDPLKELAIQIIACSGDFYQMKQSVDWNHLISQPIPGTNFQIIIRPVKPKHTNFFGIKMPSQDCENSNATPDKLSQHCESLNRASGELSQHGERLNRIWGELSHIGERPPMCRTVSHKYVNGK